MKLFSERENLNTVKDTIQIDSVDDKLRTALWNTVSRKYWVHQPNTAYHRIPPYLKEFMVRIWERLLERPLDEMGETWYAIRADIYRHFFNCEWNKVYDFIDYIAEIETVIEQRNDYINECNIILEREQSAYRFVGMTIVKITSDEEIEAVENALEDGEVYSQHINTALELLADRESPDYRNSIKESISAVESICKTYTGKRNFLDALKIIKEKNKLHPALEGAFKKLYGYTSDADGIRHALLEESNLDYNDAKFMLVICSAFINYLKIKNDTSKNSQNNNIEESTTSEVII
ncbi:MAG: hypothetical protein IIA61_00735 [Candidatus Marinimicrobia bacterium]|nr:hypothetical protein [Candidatus Neomarinimicrobiota bacterium]